MKDLDPDLTVCNLKEVLQINRATLNFHKWTVTRTNSTCQCIKRYEWHHSQVCVIYSQENNLFAFKYDQKSSNNTLSN